MTAVRFQFEFLTVFTTVATEHTEEIAKSRGQSPVLCALRELRGEKAFR